MIYMDYFLGFTKVRYIAQNRTSGRAILNGLQYISFLPLHVPKFSQYVNDLLKKEPIRTKLIDLEAFD
jgi:hypothetical protein